MNHTKNYGLPQWELNDLIRMEDFNSAMTSIESGLDSNAATAAEAKADAVSAKIVANTAKTTAETALAEKPYVVGSYTGNGESQTIDVGFRPSFVILCGTRESEHYNDGAAMAVSTSITGGHNAVQTTCKLTDTGFTVYTVGAMMPHTNTKGVAYDYIAFK